MGRFSGAWPALLTPFTRANEVNVPALRSLVDYLLGKGIGGLYVCGSTGEGVSMALAERKLVLEVVLDQVNGRVPVIAHVGAVAVPDAVALARHAQDAGADGVASIIPPLYQNADSIFDYFAALGAAAPDAPLFTYIFGGPLDAAALMRRLLAIPTVAGSKYTGPNMFEFRQIVTMGPNPQNDHGWTVFSGMDEQCLFAAMFGASGNIGSTLNYMPGVYREVHAAVQRGDPGRGVELQLAANRVTEILMGYGFMGAMKECMGLLGFDCGQPRLPNRPFDPSRRAALHEELKAADFQALAAL